MIFTLLAIVGTLALTVVSIHVARQLQLARRRMAVMARAGAELRCRLNDAHDTIRSLDEGGSRASMSSAAQREYDAARAGHF